MLAEFDDAGVVDDDGVGRQPGFQLFLFHWGIGAHVELPEALEIGRVPLRRPASRTRQARAPRRQRACSGPASFVVRLRERRLADQPAAGVARFTQAHIGLAVARGPAVDGDGVARLDAVARPARRISTAGELVSAAQCFTLPSARSHRSRWVPCGLVKRKSVTLPVSLRLCPPVEESREAVMGLRGARTQREQGAGGKKRSSGHRQILSGTGTRRSIPLITHVLSNVASLRSSAIAKGGCQPARWPSLRASMSRSAPKLSKLSASTILVVDANAEAILENR